MGKIEHELKCWPGPYDAIADGRKLFEYRKNDRDYEVGDVLHLRRFQPAGNFYTGASMRMTVTYVLRAGFGVPDGYAVLGISSLDAADALQALQSERDELKLAYAESARQRNELLTAHKGSATERDALQSKLDALEKQEPVTYARRDQLQKTRIYSHLCDLGPYPRADKVPLYLTAGATQPVSEKPPWTTCPDCGYDIARPASAKPLPMEWDAALRVSEFHQVDSAIRNLIDDPTEDNAVGLVLAIVSAAAIETAHGIKEQP